ncbi:NAD(P)-binding protein [Aureobasidium pullulans]|uniref:NAD(P)-binding protein n=1 Tax=Aureobasidium pullulans TaxID=5580 RepID=A0A4S9Y3M5_AURPU|nr:NAD(P)-binding protein [Aureobasidium pullulans]
MSKLITVFGATGNQGGSVIKHILADHQLSSEFKVRGITRDVNKPAAKALAEQGVELVTADLNNKSSVAKAIKGSHTVFLVTNYWETANPDTERTQGINVASAAKDEQISHLIFSSLINVTETTNGKLPHVPHFDSKADVEKYIRGTGVPCTFILPGYFMSNFSQMFNRGEDGVYNFALPISENAKFPLFDVAEDTGKFTNAILKNADKLNGKQVLAATAYYTPKQIVADFEQASGEKMRYIQISGEQFKSYLPEFMAEEMLENHVLLDTEGYYGGEGLEESLELLESKPVTWKQFVERSGIW